MAFGDTIIQFETKFEQALPKSLIEGRTDERPDTWVTVCTGHIGDTSSLGEGMMPWKHCSVMDERVRFVARLLEGQKMTVLCREFAISRKTGYKIFDRYKESGLEALTDRSRRPWRYGNQLQQRFAASLRGS